MEKAIVVSWDFSEKAEYALLHAKVLSDIMNIPIVLLHVVRRSKQKEEALQRLQSDSERFKELHGIETSCRCESGRLYKTIRLFLKDNDTPLVVMPFHNSRKAFKLIKGATVPFFLIKKRPDTNSFKDIVVPVDHYEENRVQLNWVVFLAKFFESNINIIKPFINSNSKNTLMKRNIFFAKQLMDSKGVDYGVRTSKRGMKFNKAISDFTNEIEADLIFMMTYNLKSYMKIEDKEQTNVPILCLNPKSVKIIPDKY